MSGFRANSTRRHALTAGASLLASPSLSSGARAQGSPITLKLHHFLPANSNGQVRFLAPWAERVAAASQGRLKVEIFPAMSLGGRPPQLYDQARDGVADLVWTLPGYTPGRFPLSEVFELPFLASFRSSVNSAAVQDFAERRLRDEFSAVHPICFWANDQGVIHSRTPIRSLADIRGQRIRFPSRITGDALKAVGANAIGMPVPQIPESIAQGVLQGAILPWEVVPALKLHELVGSHTEFDPSLPTFYTSVHCLVMNRARYQSLPADLRAVLDGLSGQTAAAMAAKAWDDEAPVARKLATDRGNSIVVAGAEETQRWAAATKPVTDSWVAATPNGADLLADATASLRRHAA